MCDCQTRTGSIVIEDKRKFIIIDHDDGQTIDLNGEDALKDELRERFDSLTHYEIERLQERIEVYEIVREVKYEAEQKIEITFI